MTRRRKINFPVVGKGQIRWPQPGNFECPVCGKLMAEGEKMEQVVLNIGAMMQNDKEKNTWCVGFNLGGFMHIMDHTHGDVDLPSISVDVVEQSAFGQADLCFCSTKCLRAFFNAIVDEADRQIREEGGK